MAAKYNFEEATKTQKMVGEFLRAFNPILEPFENLAKHGISLATGFIGVTATFVTVFNLSVANKHNYYYILFCSWVMCLGVIVFGSLQLWRTANFRDQMRKFVYVLLGDNPDKNDKKKAMRVIQQPYKSAIILEYIFLLIGVILFVVWAYSLRME